MTYDVVAGTVNNSTTDPLVKYKALLRVDDVRPHMVGIIHNDVLKQTHVLTLREVVLDSDPAQLYNLLLVYLRANRGVALSVVATSIAAMLGTMSKGNTDFAAELSFEYIANVGPTNKVRYTNLEAIIKLLGNVTPDSEQLTFTLK